MSSKALASRGNCLLSSFAIFLISDSMISSSELLLLVRLRPLRYDEVGELAEDANEDALSLYLADQDSEFSPSGLREAAVATAAATASGSAIELRGESGITELSAVGWATVGRAGKPARARLALLFLTTNIPTRMAITTTPTTAQITPIHTPLSPLLGCFVRAPMGF